MSITAAAHEHRSRTCKTGDVITIDGSLGEVLAGRMPMIEPELSGEFGTLMSWADQVRMIGVRANADTPEDARIAISSAPKASASAAPSTCSSRRRASAPCAR